VSGRVIIVTLCTAALVVLGAALPFLPGRYDPLAMPVSMVAQLFMKLSPLLIAAGVMWMIAERAAQAHLRTRRTLVVATIVVIGLGWLATTAAAMAVSLILAIALLAVGGTILLTLIRKSYGFPDDGRPRTGLPFFLLFFPLLSFATLWVLDGPLWSSARDRAMRNAAPLIASVERHRAERGAYPLSMVAVHPDIRPGVIGIERYGYEPAGEAYNLFFELPTLTLGTQEIVVYNPRDEHAMTAHALDVLQLSPEALALDRTRGHYARHDAKQPHWKYYWFD
jgi:hypothetical protein